MCSPGLAPSSSTFSSCDGRAWSGQNGETGGADGSDCGHEHEHFRQPEDGNECAHRRRRRDRGDPTEHERQGEAITGAIRDYLGRPETGLSPVAHASILFDDCCDYQEERCQSYQIDGRAKLAYGIHGRQEKKTNPEGGEGKRKKGEKPICRLAVKLPEMKGGNTTQDDDRPSDEIVHR
jgi:hypothetical protein